MPWRGGKSSRGPGGSALPHVAVGSIDVTPPVPDRDAVGAGPEVGGDKAHEGLPRSRAPRSGQLLVGDPVELPGGQGLPRCEILALGIRPGVPGCASDADGTGGPEGDEHVLVDQELVLPVRLSREAGGEPAPVVFRDRCQGFPVGAARDRGAHPARVVGDGRRHPCHGAVSRGGVRSRAGPVFRDLCAGPGPGRSAVGSATKRTRAPEHLYRDEGSVASLWRLHGIRLRASGKRLMRARVHYQSKGRVPANVICRDISIESFLLTVDNRNRVP